MSAPKEILELVERFARNFESYKSANYNETQLRREFLDPFFKALGWDIDNEQGYAEAYKDVIHEDAIKVGEATKAPDYCFRIGGARKFFLEAKKPAVDIKNDVSPAFQLRRYGWTCKLALSVLSDFEEFAVYDCRVKPDKNQNAGIGRILYIPFTEYAVRWEEIAGIFSRDAVLKGAFDKYAESNKAKRGTADVDDEFLKTIESWRKELAENLALRNKKLSQRELNFAVQRIIDRIIFLRICEGRGIEDYGRLQGLANGDRIYQRLGQLFEQADDRYNSGLFHFKAEKGRHEPPDELTLNLDLDDKLLRDILKSLYYPDSPYVFSALPAEVLGQVYEQFLGKVIRLTEGHHAKVDDKPEVKKAGGVYYTPAYIVDYIVQNTVGKLLESRTPKQAAKLRILDPACGSGSFLIGAYEHLLKWHLDYYTKNEPAKLAKGARPVLVQVSGGDWRLTISERKRILLDNIYGVDIDAQAVETTKLSLLLKVLEGETQQSLQPVLRIFHERALPDLGDNIKCGNSLIGPDFYQQQQMTLLDDEERYRINVFDWRAEFPHIFQKGASAGELRETAAVSESDYTMPGTPLHGSFSYKKLKVAKAAAPPARVESEWEGGFDAVIGNPPYIRMESFTPIKDYLRGNYQAHEERADIYTYFLERGISLLNRSGLLGMIVSNKFMKAKYGKPLREVLSDRAAVQIVADFAGANVFVGATVRTVVLVLAPRTRGAKLNTMYVPVPDKACLKAVVAKLTSVAEYARRSSFNIEPSMLVAEGWQLLPKQKTSLLRKLRNDSLELSKWLNSTALFGLKTGLNEAFVVDSAKHREFVKQDRRTNEILRPILFGKDVRRYFIERDRQFVIYCHPQKDIENYRPIRDHLLLYKQALLKRALDQKWYELQQPATHLITINARPKIVYPIIANECRFSLDTEGYFINDKTFLLPTDDLGLLGLLNSRVANFYFGCVCAALEGSSDRYLEFRAQYVDRFPMPIGFSQSKQKPLLSGFVGQMLELHKRLAAAKTPQEKTSLERQITATDTQIDRLVYELYGLSGEEIKIVEGAA